MTTKTIRRRTQITVEPDRAKALVKAIAMDIGKEVVAYVEVQYPEAIKATSSTFKLSLRNCIYNQIMAALDTTEENAIIARLQERRKWRREWTAMWRKLRSKIGQPENIS